MSARDLGDRDAAQGLGWQLRWALVIVACLAIFGIGAMLLTRSVVRAYVISSGSMMPTLLQGDQVFFNMTAYGLRDPVFGGHLWPGAMPPPRRGDIAVMDWDGTMTVGRIIGLPGEQIAIRDRQVYIGGAAISEPYAVHGDSHVNPSGARDNLAAVEIPPGQVFVMGDNRDRSYDSRFRGVVPVEALRGRAGLIYYSWDRARNRVRWERMGHAPGATPGSS